MTSTAVYVADMMKAIEVHGTNSEYISHQTGKASPYKEGRCQNVVIQQPQNLYRKATQAPQW